MLEAVIVVVPAARSVMVPLLSMVATSVSDEVKATLMLYSFVSVGKVLDAPMVASQVEALQARPGSVSSVEPLSVESS